MHWHRLSKFRGFRVYSVGDFTVGWIFSQLNQKLDGACPSTLPSSLFRSQSKYCRIWQRQQAKASADSPCIARMRLLRMKTNILSLWTLMITLSSSVVFSFPMYITIIHFVNRNFIFSPRGEIASSSSMKRSLVPRAPTVHSLATIHQRLNLLATTLLYRKIHLRLHWHKTSPELNDSPQFELLQRIVTKRTSLAGLISSVNLRWDEIDLECRPPANLYARNNNFLSSCRVSGRSDSD